MKDLGKRIFFSLIAIVIVGGMIILAKYPYLSFLVALLASIIGALAAAEFIQMAKIKSFILSTRLIIGAVVIEIFSFFIAAHYLYLTKLPLIVFFLFVLILFLSHLRDVDGAIPNIAVSIFSIIYIAIPVGMLLAIFHTPFADGRWWVFYLIAVTKMNDIGGYFSGKIFGKKKLAASISPHKTIAGSVGGLVCAIAISIVFSFWSKETNIHFTLNFIPAVILAVIFSIGAQIGDLAESLLKRDAKIKDSSTIPGVGGILDMLDSLIFNIPMLYFYLT